MSDGEYTLWQDQMLGGEAGDRLWSYWRGKLAPPRERVTLPTDQARPPIQTFQGASLPLRLEAGTVQRLMSLARQERTTPFVVLMAAFQVLLSRLTGAEDMIVGTSTFARSKPEFMQVVGDFVNSVPVRGRVAAILTFRDLVAQMTATVLEAIDAQEFPLALLVQRLQPERNANSSPLFDTFFSYLRFEQFKGFGLLYGGSSDDAIEVGGLRLAPFPIAQGAGQFELSLQLVEIAGSVRGVFNYRSDLFEGIHDTALRHRGTWPSLMRAQRIRRLLLGTMRRPIDAAAARGSDVVAFLQLLRQRDIQIFLDGDRLRVNAPKGAVDAEIRAAITAQRDDIIAALQASDVASPECDAGPIGGSHATGRSRYRLRNSGCGSWIRWIPVAPTTMLAVASDITASWMQARWWRRSDSSLSGTNRYGRASATATANRGSRSTRLPTRRSRLRIFQSCPPKHARRIDRACPGAAAQAIRHGQWTVGSIPDRSSGSRRTHAGCQHAPCDIGRLVADNRLERNLRIE